MKQIVAILMLLALAGVSQAQNDNWRDWDDGGEVNCGVVQRILNIYGSQTLFRDVPDVENFTVRLWLDEVFSVCNDDADGASMSSARATSTQPSPTSTPPGLTGSNIRSLVSRYTKDIRILTLDVSSNAITIEYDLKPWPFVPNESIAEEVTFKVICAIRKGGKRIPSTLRFIGQGRFKTDLGRKTKSPSVEIHISANTANQLVCQGNSANDINWRRVATRYKSYPIPKGMSVDYD